MSSGSTPHASTPASGLLARVRGRLGQFICGLQGHDTLLHFGPDRVSLRCVTCAYETPGWQVAAAPPRKTPPVAATSARVVQLPLVEERRVA